MADFPHDGVVAVFNALGYEATFAAVAEELAAQSIFAMNPADVLESLYRDYASREALGEAWLSEAIPDIEDNQGLAEDFSDLVFALLKKLESRRDFARSWMAGMKVSGAFHLRQYHDLHESVRGYFIQVLASHGSRIGLPGGLDLDDVQDELMDLMSALSLALLAHWETDRSAQYDATCRMTEAVGYLLDGLLIKRVAFGNTSLLVSLHTLAAVQRDRFIKPVLDMLLKEDRAKRFADPLSLLELLRSTKLWPVDRP